MNVLFVCSGNICRSPAAAICFRRGVLGQEWIGWTADSAGTLGIEGRPICPDAARVLGEIGIEVGEHRSKGVRRENVEAADWIVAMEREHLDWLSHRFPGGRGRRTLLRAFERDGDPDPAPRDLIDPYGQPIDVYRREIARIVRCVDHLLAHLRSAA